MPSTTPTSPSSAGTRASAISSGSPDAAGRLPGPAPALVAIGGGTGLSALLRGLKHHVGSPRLRQITGVVTVADDGGSSGRLRREFGVLPPGDIRNCIAALADDEDLLTRLFQYRFPNGGSLMGHSFGNLFLTALTGITGDHLELYEETGSEPVQTQREALEGMGIQVVEADLLAEGELIRHDSGKL